VELVVSILNSIGIRWQLVLLQLIAFLLVFKLILKPILFGRVQRVLDERAHEEEHLRSAIAAARKEQEAAKAKAEAKNAEVEKQAYEQAQAEVRAGLKRKADAVAAAMERSRAEVNQARVGFAKEHEEALAKLRADVADLALFVAADAARAPELTSNPTARDTAGKVVSAAMAKHGKAFAAGAAS
jgi:F-type H+-transporting ATPase subunit b